MDAKKLKQLRLFRRSTRKHQEQVARFSRLVHHGAGAWLFHEGDAAESVVGVLAGRVKVFKTGPSGKEAILQVFGPGDSFAEVPAIDEGAYPASAVTMEPSEVVLISAAGLRDLLARDSALALQLIRDLAWLLRSTTHRIQALQTERVEPRLANLLLQLGKRLGETSDKGVRLPGKWTRQDLADLVGATQETVIRILSRWQKLGWIESGAEIAIRDLEALAARRDALDD